MTTQTSTLLPSTYLTKEGKTVRTLTKSAALAILRAGGTIEVRDGLHQEAEFHVVYPAGTTYKAWSEYSNEMNSDTVLPDGTGIGGERHLFIRLATWEECVKDMRGFDEVEPGRLLKMSRWQSREALDAIRAEV